MLLNVASSNPSSASQRLKTLSHYNMVLKVANSNPRQASQRLKTLSLSLKSAVQRYRSAKKGGASAYNMFKI